MSVTAVVALAMVAAPADAQSGRVVYRVPVSGVIELGLAPFIERSIDDAERAGALAVILDMDTPGGRVDAAERIADAVADAEIPVYTLVNRRAFSAGALISLATDRIYMRPGSVIGAATPVDGSGTKAPEKIVSAMRSEMRALAEARGLDPAVAEAMVDESIEIAGVVAEGKLLTLTTEEAVSVGYAEEVDDLAALLEIVGASGAEVIETSVNWAERIVRLLSNPVVSPFLLSLGFLGLLIEIKTPGLGLAGAAGLLSLSLFFGSHLIIGLAGMEELLIIGAGSVLVAVEVFVIPGFGLFGVLGGAGILGGLYMSLVGDAALTADLTTAGWVLSTTVAIILVTGWAILKRLPHSDRLFPSPPARTVKPVTKRRSPDPTSSAPRVWPSPTYARPAPGSSWTNGSTWSPSRSGSRRAPPFASCLPRATVTWCDRSTRPHSTRPHKIRTLATNR